MRRVWLEAATAFENETPQYAHSIEDLQRGLAFAKSEEKYKWMDEYIVRRFPQIEKDKALIALLLKKFSESINYRRIDGEFDTQQQYPIHAQSASSFTFCKYYQKQSFEQMTPRQLSSARVEFSGYDILITQLLCDIINIVREHDRKKLAITQQENKTARV